MNEIDIDLDGLPRDEWLAEMAEFAGTDGWFEQHGPAHWSSFLEKGSTLLVTFEALEPILSRPRARPRGFDLAEREGWSHLGIYCGHDSWFRAPELYGLFDGLTDEGFFEAFDNVIFYGAQAGGYAAAAYSVASPGATVIAFEPQATLDPRVTGWDGRFRHMRRTDFTSRYGYAPDMLDGARRAHIFYDPQEELDAMHAALFARQGIARYPLAHFGGTIEMALDAMGMLPEVIARLADPEFQPLAFWKMFRKRRNYGPYLRHLLGYLDANDRPVLEAMLCMNVNSRMRAAKFKRRLASLRSAARAGDLELPARLMNEG